MNGIPLLVLRVEAPMQSWGLRSRWDERDTGTEPSKSGIIGLLGCALGYHRDDKRLETELDANLRIGVREDRHGKIAMDYHTVKPPSEGEFTTASGAKNYTVKTIVSRRAYIEDAAFLVIISGPADLLEKCRDALLSPAWVVYLGRKSCVPTRPVFETITTEYGSVEDALRRYPGSDLSYVDSNGTCVMDDPDGNATRPDATIVRPVHERATRRVRTFSVAIPPPAGGGTR